MSTRSPDGTRSTGFGIDGTPMFDATAPRIAVSFSDADEARLAAAVAAGMDVAELRIDRFADVTPDRVVDVARRFASVPTIATIRSSAEGGGWTGDDHTRSRLFEAVVPHVDVVDVELSSTAVVPTVVAAAHDHGRRVIVSSHDFDGTPSTDRLDEVIRRSVDVGADVVKVATTVHASEDLRTLATVLCRGHDTALIVIGMGPVGAPSRLLFPFLGSLLTFAAHGEPSAPGQLALADVARTFRSLSPDFADRHPGDPG